MTEPLSASAELTVSPTAPGLPESFWGWVALAWGIGGVVSLLVRAIWRIGRVALELDWAQLSSLHLAVGGAWIAFMAYSEGYRAFQLRFSPRVVGRAFWLSQRPRLLWVALAPLFCMGLIHATARRLIASWSILLMIVALIVIVRHLAQPWRGLVDAGVVVGLVWGVVAILAFALEALRGRPIRGKLELPGQS